MVFLRDGVIRSAVNFPALPAEEKRKIGLFCNVRESSVIQAMDSADIYAVPLDYHREGLDAEVLAHFGLSDAPAPLGKQIHGLPERFASYGMHDLRMPRTEKSERSPYGADINGLPETV